LKLCLNPNWNNFADPNWPPFAVPSMRLWDTADTWLDIEKSAGNYSWATLDAHLSALTAHGITDLLYTAGKIPTFYGVASVAQFGAFVSALAAHIGSTWKGTWAFEQWNEPNLGQFYSGTAAQLLAFSRAAYAILKPLGVKVLSPSGSGGTAIGNFILSYLTACAGNYPFDVFAYHCYLGDKNPDPTTGIGLILNDIKVKKSTFGISAMETWFTEGSWGRATDYSPSLTDTQTAAWLTTAVPIMAKSVARHYHYAFNNSAGFGVLATGTPPVLNLAGLMFQALVTGGSVPTTSTVNIPVPASQVTAPAIAVPVPASSVMAPSVSVAVPASTVQAPSQTVPVPASQVAITVVDATANGVNQAWNGNTLTLTDKVPAPAPTPTPTTIGIGVAVTTTGLTNVRQTAGGTLLGTVPLGTSGKVVAGPGTANSNTWWQVQFPTINGWVGADMLALGSSPPNPNPQPSPSPSGALAAFLGAQGGGAQAVGGRGGAVFEVTNLNDSGAGSLRAALQATGARTIVFRVGGVINVVGDLRIGSPFVTVAGHTAPGGGIKLAGTGAVMWVNTHDAVIRYIGYDGNSANNGPDVGSVSFDAGSGDVYNVVFDHCSGFHVTNKQLIVLANSSGRVRNVTFQWCMTFKPDKNHPVGPMVDATTWPAKDVTDIDYHHNFFGDTSHRLPLFNGKSGRWVNNLVYNWDWFAGLWQGGCTPDIIGNKYVAGNMNVGDNSGHPHPLEFTATQSTDDTSQSMPGPPLIFLKGNIGPQLSDPTGNQALLCGKVNSEGGAEVGPVDAAWFRSSPLPTLPIPITEDDARNLDAILIPLVGNSQQLNADGSLSARRQVEDAAMIAEYQNKTPGSLWTAPAGYVTAPVANGQPYPSSQHDGLSDVYKQAMGLDTSKPMNNFVMPDGLTALDWFLSGRKS